MASANDTMPLFGDDSRKLRMFDWLQGFLSLAAVLAGLIFSILKAKDENLHYIMGAMLVLVTIPHWILVFWFYRGELDPKFRFLITYMTISLIALNVVAILYLDKL